MEDHDETDDTALDPRIQIELEKLNTATDEINRLEVELDEANTTFRILQNECTRRISLMKEKLGSCIQKARPYYDALEIAKEAQLECQKAAIQFQRANEIHQAAKETVALAETRFLSKQHEWQFDNAWQEMLNHATIKVTDAETQKAECGREHQKKALVFHEAEQKVQQLEQKLRRYINKSRPFFDERDLCIGQLSAQKDRIITLQKQVTSMKESYAASLKELESISEEIHRKRKTNTSLDQPEAEAGGEAEGDGDADPPKGPREPGVGAELTPVFQEEPAMFQEKKTPSQVPEESKPATEANCDIFYFEPKKSSPGRASLAPLPLLDNLALVRKSEDGPEVPIPCASSGFAHWTDDFKAELDKFDLTSLGSMSVATGSSAVSELGEGEELEDLSDFQGSLGMLSLQSPGAGPLKSKSMPASPIKAGLLNPGCLTPPPSPAHLTSSKVVFSTDAPSIIPEERLDCPLLTERKVDENCSL